MEIFMCGIFATTGSAINFKTMLNGLKKLEYRGYDSAGVYISSLDSRAYCHSIGNIKQLSKKEFTDLGTLGLSHTRWATHGKVTEENTHPFIFKSFALVHNGIIENFDILKGQYFKTTRNIESDTKLIGMLIQLFIESGDAEFSALKKTASLLQGQNAIVVAFHDDPTRLYTIRKKLPLVFGKNDSNQQLYLSSDQLTIDSSGKYQIPDESIGIISLQMHKFESVKGIRKLNPIQLKLSVESTINTYCSEKPIYIQEIEQQPNILDIIISKYINWAKPEINSKLCGIEGINLGKVDRIIITGCGSAYHGGLFLKKFLEQYIRIPVNVELANELTLTSNLISPKALFIAFSQSGETADILSAVYIAKKGKCQILSFCNRDDSELTRLSDKTILLSCDQEYSVASTKVLSSMVLCSYLFALDVAKNRGLLKKRELLEKIMELKDLKSKLDNTIKNKKILSAKASELAQKKHLIIIGRHFDKILGLEAALKIKELTYIPCDAIASGELKHGSLALVEEGYPVLSIQSDSNLKQMNQLTHRELTTRGTNLFQLISDKEPLIVSLFIQLIKIQLLSFHMATYLKRNVDQPRNLAKSVTVA